jgi:hypothetical protein
MNSAQAGRRAGSVTESPEEDALANLANLRNRRRNTLAPAGAARPAPLPSVEMLRLSLTW